MKSIPELETERLLLRGFTLSDKEVVQVLCDDKDIASKTLSIPHPFNMEDAEAWIQDKIAFFKQGKEMAWAICTIEDGTLLGAVGLTMDSKNDAAELGFWMGREYRGRGYVTEAAKGVIDLAFLKLELNRVEAKHMAGNVASSKVLEKLGMQHEGLHRQQIKKWGEFKDIKSYAIIRSDYL